MLLSYGADTNNQLDLNREALRAVHADIDTIRAMPSDERQKVEWQYWEGAALAPLNDGENPQLYSKAWFPRANTTDF